MYWLFDAIRRLIAAALVIALLACAVEVALRCQRFQAGQIASHSTPAGIPILPSRSTGTELASAWTGVAEHAEHGTPLPLRVSSLGLRGPELPRTKPPGTLRILCLGDETTLAPGLLEEEAYPGQLATALRGKVSTPIEILNAGLPDGCPLTELIQYRRLLDGLQPDVVILHVDISDAADDRAARLHLRIDDAGEPVAVVHPSFEVAEGPLAMASREFAIVDWLARRVGDRLAGEPHASRRDLFQQQLLSWDSAGAPGDSEVPLVLRPLLTLQQWLTAEGATLVLGTCPNAWQAAELLRQARGDGSGNALLNAPATAVQAVAGRQGLTHVDATSLILRHPEPARLYLPDGSGLSTEGHALYAAELARCLTGDRRAAQITPETAPRR